LLADILPPIGKQVSFGTVALFCLNLPPSLRNKQENIFLFGIIPGKKEPSTSQLNHVLRPLVDELLFHYSDGITIITPSSPEGRLFRSVLLTLVSDLPAARKAAGLASHSAYFFCGSCVISKNNIHSLDHEGWQIREGETQRAWAQEWLEIGTKTARARKLRATGVRWSVLNNLPYWDPVEMVVLDTMHLLSGLLSFHGRRVLEFSDEPEQKPIHQDELSDEEEELPAEEHDEIDEDEDMDDENEGHDREAHEGFTQEIGDGLRAGKEERVGPTGGPQRTRQYWDEELRMLAEEKEESRGRLVLKLPSSNPAYVQFSQFLRTFLLTPSSVTAELYEMHNFPMTTTTSPTILTVPILLSLFRLFGQLFQIPSSPAISTLLLPTWVNLRTESSKLTPGSNFSPSSFLSRRFRYSL